MGDISTEPSMEEILSSIKRIIAEEGDAAVATRTRRAGKPATTITAVPAPADPVEDDLDDGILELSEPVPDPVPMAAAQPQPEPEPQPQPVQQAQPAPMPIGAPDAPHRPRPETIVSERAVEATRGPLEALSKIVVKPEVTGTDTLEGLVRELLKPMLREWLDANLPQVVEAMVAREIARITGR